MFVTCEKVSERTLVASSVGQMARDILSQETRASMMGVTSRGVFLRTSGPWVIFVTDEPYRGPLTINLSESMAGLRDLEVGSPVSVTRGELMFPGGERIIARDDATEWYCSIPCARVSPISEQHRRLTYLSRQALARGRERGFRDLLPSLLDPELASCESDVELEILSDVMAMRCALAHGDVQATASRAWSLLGLGPGLTPSGDDLLTGLILLLNRWGDLQRPDLDLEELNCKILSTAYERTTTLSANLIECASRGQSDERLVAVVDSVVTGVPGESEGVSNLLGWGSSSGVDALVGVAVGWTALATGSEAGTAL
jgi:hypothetical protein